MAAAKTTLLLLLIFLLMPISVSAVLHRTDAPREHWYAADRSSAGLLPPASRNTGAVVRVFAAKTVRWRGIFAVHCWIVYKAEGASSYTRYDYTAWGEPIRRNGFEPDGRWFGRVPDVIFAADGAEAAALIPRIEGAITEYIWRNLGDYRVWPGPNSNTFVQAVLDTIPEARVVLPPTAIGKDYPYDGRWLRLAPSRTGIKLTLGGYAGLTLAWVEGIEVNILAAVIGVDIRRPALKLPGLGRIGLPAPA
ncbi:MAG: DUF3750 domain-containing protein [Acetobacteraceae bacterium]